MGGWKDANEVPEPGVTAATTNLYADRNAIAQRYTQEPLLGSRFWYHGEVFEGARLKMLSQRAGPPDFSAYLTANSALLCYYFFFPAHQQSVNAECGSLAAREAACHAGDWQCIAILLEGDGSGNAAAYVPKFFGCTGARPLPVDGDSKYRPYDFDDDGYTVMKVERWRPASGPAKGLPEVDGDHPRLYVSLGTHSLYTKPGTYELRPFRDGEASQGCATFDTPSVMPKGWGQPEQENLLENMGAFFGKLFGGMAAGAAVGGGAPGAVAGIVLAAAEGTVPKPMGLNIVGTYDPPDPDQTAPAAGGITIKPRGVTVAGAGIAEEEWQVQAALPVGGRIYSHLVNRETQRWWPNDDNETGYRGRWGQRVTKDFLPRRAGPRFPDYLKMFLSARGDGDGDQAFVDE